MTMTDTERDRSRDRLRDRSDTPLTPEEQRAAARLAYHESGGTLTGKDLAEMFKRSAKWGQNQRAAAEREAAERAAGGTGPAVPRQGGTVPTSVPRNDGNGNAGVPRDVPRKVNGTAKRTDPPVPRHQPAARRRNTSGGSRAVTVLAVVVVAAVAAVASFDHQRELAVLAGEGWRAWLLPFSVDGLVVAATMVMLDRRRAGQSAGALPWLSLVLGVAASLAANVAAAEPTVAGRLVAAWPPVALLLAFELLLRQVDGGRR